MFRLVPLCLLLCACQPESEEASAPRDADTVDTTVPDVGAVDAEPPALDAGSTPVGAPCAADAECRRGECVHGVCSTICIRDADCDDDALICVGRGGAGRCTRRCGRAADCPDDLVCAVEGPARGFCVAPGAGGFGAECALRADCASWVCSAGACLAACDRDDCPEDEACLALHTQNVCVGAGAGPLEAPCVEGADCVSGVCRGGRCSGTCARDAGCPNDRICVDYPVVALCERRCADSADCGPTGICTARGAEQLCATRGFVEDDAPCAADEECASGHCGEGRCAPPCAAGECAEGRACVRDIGGATCRPAGSTRVGEACERGAECATGFCAAGRCAPDCADGAACPEGLRCTRFVSGEFCFPICGADDDCVGATFCDPGFAEGRTCFWRGPGAAGERCAADRDCWSGRCEAGACLELCPDGRCPAGAQCRDFGTTALCTGDALPEGAACGGEATCAEGLRCAGGRCLPACAGGQCPRDAVCAEQQCRPGCDADDECRPGLRCNRFDRPRPYCETPGERSVPEPCERSGECASGLCFQGVCRAGCAAGCGPEEACVQFGDAGWCLPVGERPVGARCTADAECAGGLCVGRRCAGPCAAGCPESTECRRLRGGSFCVHRCAPGAQSGCDDDEVCGIDGRCAARTPDTPPGTPCVTAADCGAGSAGCLDAGDGPRCRAPCPLSGAQCADEQACTPISFERQLGACVEAGALPEMAPCVVARDCASGWCADYLGGRCARPCDADEACGAEQRCVDLARDPRDPVRSCAPRCVEAADCEAPLACRRGLDDAGACY